MVFRMRILGRTIAFDELVSEDFHSGIININEPDIYYCEALLRTCVGTVLLYGFKHNLCADFFRHTVYTRSDRWEYDGINF